MADVADVPRNRRRPKFTVDELEVLVDQMQRNKSTLLGKLSDVHAAQTKNDAWRAIAAMISAISNVGRTADEVRRKWQDWASVVKQKELLRQKAMKKTGGGKDEKTAVLSPVEEKVIAVLGLTACEGIAGAVDSYAEQPSQKKRKVSCAGNVEVALVVPPAPVQLTPVQSSSVQSRSSVRPQTSTHNVDVSSEKATPAPLTVTPVRRQCRTPVTEQSEIVSIERERLAVEKDRLVVEKERLAVDKKKCAVLEKLLELEKGKRYDNRAVLHDNGNVYTML